MLATIGNAVKYTNLPLISKKDRFSVFFALTSFRYFIPIGQFEEEETADASFAGIVKSIELKTNSHTGLSFYHLIVENAAMDFDVIMEEKFTPKIE